MTKEEILKKVIDIVGEQLFLDPKNVTPTAHIVDELNADSLDCVEMVIALEEEFGIAIPEGDAENLKTVNDAVEYLVSRGV